MIGSRRGGKCRLIFSGENNGHKANSPEGRQGRFKGTEIIIDGEGLEDGSRKCSDAVQDQEGEHVEAGGDCCV